MTLVSLRRSTPALSNKNYPSFFSNKVGGAAIASTATPIDILSMRKIFCHSSRVESSPVSSGDETSAIQDQEMKVQLQLLILLAQVVEYFVKGKKMIRLQCIMVHYYDQALSYVECSKIALQKFFLLQITANTML